MSVLVTGAAGFIGYHVSEALLARGERVVGYDNVNAYYDPSLKEARLARLRAHDGFSVHRADLADRAALARAFDEGAVDRVVHLAAQAGVRYSIEAPHTYAEANLTGFLNILEACRAARTAHLVYASTSSVYGANAAHPLGEGQGVSHPMSLYAATKRANEAMAHSYAHLFDLPLTGLRFFTVYGPWGRPDMALFKFTRAILEGRPIQLFNHGEMSRDFTYVSDIVDGVLRALDRPAAADPDWRADAAAPDPSRSAIAPFRVYNIGRGQPVALKAFVRTLEDELGRRAEVENLPMQPGDVHATHADVSALARDTGYAPRVSVEEGVRAFVAWYRDHYAI